MGARRYSDRLSFLVSRADLSARLRVVEVRRHRSGLATQPSRSPEEEIMGKGENQLRAEIQDEVDDLAFDVRERWKTPNWRLRYPHWRRPRVVKILFYADGRAYSELTHVLAVLASDPYWWVRFEVTTVHRLPGQAADHAGLDVSEALALDDFDEMWLYNVGRDPDQLSAGELGDIHTFMDAGKGLMISGDHASLGKSFSKVQRAGKMRIWDDLYTNTVAPPPSATQSDDKPQTLQLKTYWAGFLSSRPHQLLCAPTGPVNIFPDHGHESEVIEPAPTPASEWPDGIGAEVIAWGTDHGNGGRKFGVLSVYDGHETNGEVGRIIADSSWHHHLNLNLIGFIDGSGKFSEDFKKIEQYFVNAAIWLAPPEAQRAMRLAALWGSWAWSSEMMEASIDWQRRFILGQAYDALGRSAPQCLMLEWIWVIINRRVIETLQEGGFDGRELQDTAVEVLARRMVRLRDELGDTSFKDPPSLKVIEAALEGAEDEVLKLTAERCERNFKILRSAMRE